MLQVGTKFYTRKLQELSKLAFLHLIRTTRFGHSNDQKFFANQVVARFSSLLSVNNDRQSVCLSPYGTSFVYFIALFEKAATAPSVKNEEVPSVQNLTAIKYIIAQYAITKRHSPSDPTLNRRGSTVVRFVGYRNGMGPQIASSRI